MNDSKVAETQNFLYAPNGVKMKKTRNCIDIFLATPDKPQTLEANISTAFFFILK
jgi:hypothetical protein